MSEPGGGVIDVGTRRRCYRCQNQEEELLMSELGGDIDVG